ncbi:MAG: hypothetical protein CVU38_10105 [Chloroflexi bacterium HGW-Chloroflexi-1]|nr:MAG: hypothetical protein CVU38_10105 [Chloroflexi bacterium HGW-Chloroflexi-1]
MINARFVRFYKALLVVFIIPALFLPAALPARAQGGTVEVRTYGIDYAAFPNVCLRLAAVTANGTQPADLSAEAFQVYENGEARPATSVTKDYAGIQVAIVLDASGSFNKPSVVDKTNRRFDDAIQALDELVLAKGQWLQQDRLLDQMLLIAPTGPDTFKIALPDGKWTTEPVSMHNNAYVLDPVNSDTPLYKMLVEAMVRMKDLPDYQQRAKFLLVLSDGVDRTSAQDVTDVINRANSLGVKILSVKIGPEAKGDSLKRMAEETSAEGRPEWAYTNYAGPASLAPLYSAIKAQAEQYLVCYRSKINQAGPQNIEVGVRIGGQESKSRSLTVAIAPKPPAVRITVPGEGTVYDRVASSYDQDPATIEPREQPVTVEVSWPDNFSRGIQRVIYEVDGAAVANLTPEEAFTWDFSRLPAGIHSLRAVVRDELGLEGRSDPIQTTIAITIPPAPTPAPTPTPRPPTFWEQVRRLPGEQPVLLVVLLVALIAAALALYALIRLLRNPTAREAMTTTVVGMVRDATEVFRPKRTGGKESAGAALVPIVDDAGSLGDPIPIRAQSVSIGRDPARAQIVFSDKSVSRLHSRIVEEADNDFVIHDEGSSSGTYVNEERVEFQPKKLKAGDLIEFGRVKVRFQLQGSAPPLPTETNVDDVTEPFVGRR